MNPPSYPMYHSPLDMNLMLHSCFAGVIRVSVMGSHSSDLAVFMSFEVVKWKQHGHYKADLLHFNTSV